MLCRLLSRVLANSANDPDYTLRIIEKHDFFLILEFTLDLLYYNFSSVILTVIRTIYSEDSETQMESYNTVFLSRYRIASRHSWVSFV